MLISFHCFSRGKLLYVPNRYFQVVFLFKKKKLLTPINVLIVELLYDDEHHGTLE